MRDIPVVGIDDYTRRNLITALLFQSLYQHDPMGGPVKVMQEAYDLMKEIEEEVFNGA